MDEEDEEEEGEDDGAHESVAVDGVMVMMLCGLEEREAHARHPHTLSDVQGSPPPCKPFTSTLTPSYLEGFGAYLHTICAHFLHFPPAIAPLRWCHCFHLILCVCVYHVRKH